MREETVRALNALNRDFYAAIAHEWSETRQHAWPGFERVLAAAQARRAEGAMLSVLDVGAGDGRLAEYLSGRPGLSFSYLGVDQSGALLARSAERALAATCRFVQADIVEDRRWLAAAGTGPFTLVTVFGVMHHVPSGALRMQLLSELAATLAPGGLLALAFWRLDEDARFARRLRAFGDWNARSPAAAIDESDLEPGDVLLSWGDAEAPPRYCHFADPAEIDALIATSGLRVQDRFRADGRGGSLNEYVLLIR